MWWKFWKPRRKKTSNDTEQDTVRAAPDESAGPAAMGPLWAGAAGVREVLALQHLVGNQAVLEMLARRTMTAKTRDHGS